MAFRYFPRRTQKELEDQIDALDAEEMGGSNIISVSAGDTSNTSQLQHGFGERRRRIMWDLCVLDPEQYVPGDVLTWTTSQVRFRSGWQ